jgi:hypothetical protein
MINKMFLLLCLFFYAFLASTFSQMPLATAKPIHNRYSPTPTPQSTQPSRPALGDVIQEVKKAVDKYQESLGGGAAALPPLLSAEFDFKVATEKNIRGGISLFIISFGASTGDTTVNDVTYTYELPKPSLKALSEKPSELTESLARTIQDAAREVKESGAIENLKFTKLVVEIQYGVKWTREIDGSFTYQFVTLKLGAGQSKNTVQSVKLTFKKPDQTTPTLTPTPTPTKP